MTTYRVDSETPCCGAAVRLMANFPKEEYYRRCSACGTRWRIERAGKVIESGPLVGAQADVIGWTRVGL